tara:strand:+ start:322 stop:654 length:333 start_codon:yes stop_codon:yes gene_type:complete
MIRVILEIPHRGDASAWIAWSDGEYLDAVDKAGFDSERFGELSIETAEDFIRRDNHSTWIFCDDPAQDMLGEMVDFLYNYDGHQASSAKTAIGWIFTLFNGTDPAPSHLN